jgi:hypothetical protein
MKRFVFIVNNWDTLWGSLKRKSDEKEKANQAHEDQEQMFVVTLNANDHTM